MGFCLFLYVCLFSFVIYEVVLTNLGEISGKIS